MKYAIAAGLAAALTLSLMGCTFESTMRGSLFRKDPKVEADAVVLAVDSLRNGASEAQVIQDLEARGLSEKEAKRIEQLAKDHMNCCRVQVSGATPSPQP